MTAKAGGTGKAKTTKKATGKKQEALGSSPRTGSKRPAGPTGKKRARGRVSGNFDGETLEILFKRIVNLQKEMRADMKNYREDINALYGEAVQAGFKAKVLRKIVAEQLEERKPTQEDIDLEQLYREKLGLPLLTPLEAYAAERAQEKGRTGGGNGGDTGGGDGATGGGSDAPQGAGDAPQGEAGASAAAIAGGVIQSIGKGRLAMKSASGGFTIERAPDAIGALGHLFDQVHDVLIEKGFTLHSGGIYRAPGQQDARSAAAGAEDDASPPRMH